MILAKASMKNCVSRFLDMTIQLFREIKLNLIIGRSVNSISNPPHLFLRFILNRHTGFCYRYLIYPPGKLMVMQPVKCKMEKKSQHLGESHFTDLSEVPYQSLFIQKATRRHFFNKLTVGHERYLGKLFSPGENPYPFNL